MPTPHDLQADEGSEEGEKACSVREDGAEWWPGWALQRQMMRRHELGSLASASQLRGSEDRQKLAVDEQRQSPSELSCVKQSAGLRGPVLGASVVCASLGADGHVC